MKYLKKFETEADKNAWLAGSEFVTPNVVLTEGKVGYNEKIDYSLLPLHIEAIEDLTISFSNNYEYSKDRTTWSSGTSSTFISASAGEKVYFRASGLTPDSYSGIGTFAISNGACNVAGNVMSMAYGADFVGKMTVVEYQFRKLFEQGAKIIDASNFILPATTLASNCYSQMFSNCKSLVNAPTLPATTLASRCYDTMFGSCKSLVNAPTLPATTLASNCYFQMFNNCTSLVNAPTLPATTLVSNCYESMFRYCTSLVNAPTLPATTLVKSCYRSMFSNCTSLVNAPTLPVTTLAERCYDSMFNNCTSLVTAPALPATTLESNCYCTMFNGCTKLNYIKAMFTTEPSSSYTSNWVSGVSSSGTFVKNSAATWNVTGVNGIPEGWTVETADA